MYYDVIVLSGGFDPMHVGHLRMIQESAKMAEIVIAGVNSDEWLMRKKGYVFMPHEERVEMVQGTRGVSKAMAFDDDDNSACDLLRRVRALWPNFKVAFANGTFVRPNPFTRAFIVVALIKDVNRTIPAVIKRNWSLISWGILVVSATIRAIAKPITPLSPPHHNTIESFTETP